jgi:hypothetical protein
MDHLLLACFGASVVTFIAEPITDSNAYARYLIPAVVTGAIAGGRQLARLLEASGGVAMRTALVGLVVLGATLGASLDEEVAGAPVPIAATTLASFLESHHLDHGVADYWDASVITVASGGRVVVRPVIAYPTPRIVRYDKQSSASWYGRSKDFDFLVFNSGAIWNGVDRSAALATFGAPNQRFAIGTYRIYYWSKPFTLAVRGSTGP